MSSPGTLRPAPIAWDAFVLCGLYALSLAVASSELMTASPQLVGTAVLLDLVVSAVLCHWLLGVRLGGVPAWTLVPLAGAGATLGHLILPPGVVADGGVALTLVAAVEGAALLLVVARIRTVVAGYRAERRRGADAFSALEAGLLALGAYAAPVARWARLELELWCFAFFGWFARVRVPAGAAAFSHHREPGWSALAAVLTLLVLVEGALAHLWLASAGFVALKWLALAVHAYGLIWLWGDAHALRLRRTLLHTAGEPCLELCIGVRARARLAPSDITEVRAGSWDAAAGGEQMLRISGPANLRITFRQDVCFHLALRAPVGVRVLLLQVDEPGRLATLLAEHARLPPAAG
jgi:hypothetical protein